MVRFAVRWWVVVLSLCLLPLPAFAICDPSGCWILASDYGVTCNGTTDDATSLQNAVNAAKTGTQGFTLMMPEPPSGGSGKLGSTVTANNVNGFRLVGNGVNFTRSGNNSTPMFLCQDCRQVDMGHFQVTVTNATPLLSVFQFENGSGSIVTPTTNYVHDVFIECTNGGCTNAIRMAVVSCDHHRD